MELSTALIGGALALIVAAILWRMIRRRKAGTCGCGCCGDCTKCASTKDC